MLFVVVLTFSSPHTCRSSARPEASKPEPQLSWLDRFSMQLPILGGGLGRVFASLAPGPGMASAAAVSALDPEPLFVLSAKRKFLSVYQGLRKEAAA